MTPTNNSTMLDSSPPHLRLEAREKDRHERQQYYSQFAELSRQEKKAKQNAQQQRPRMERVRKSYPVTPERMGKYSSGSKHAADDKQRQSIEISVVEYVTPNKRQADIHATPRPEAPKLFVERDEVASPESPVEFGRHTAARAKECLEKARANKLAEKKALTNSKSISAEKQIHRKSYALEYLQTLFDEHSEVSFGRYTAARAQVSQEKSLAHQKETAAALQNTISPSKRKETEGFTTPKAKKTKAVPSTVPLGRHTAARAKVPFRKRESILMDPEMLQSNDKPKRLNIPPKLRSASRAREREEKKKHFSEAAERVQEEKRKKIEAKRQEVELEQLKKSLAPVYTPPPERLLNTEKTFGVHSAARAIESYRYRSPKNEKPKFKARDVPTFPEDNVPKSKGFLLFQKSRHEKFEKQQKEEQQNAQAFDFKPRSLPTTTFHESQPAALQDVIERNKKRREAIEKKKIEKEKQRLEQMKFVASPVPASCKKPHRTFKRHEEEALKKAEEVREQKLKEFEKEAKNEGNHDFKARPLPSSIQKDLASFPKQTKTSRARKKLAIDSASKQNKSTEAKSWWIAFTPTSRSHERAKARKVKTKAEAAQDNDSEADKLLCELLGNEDPPSSFQAMDMPKSSSSPPDIFPRETKTSRARREKAMADSPQEDSPEACKENRPTKFKARPVPKSAFLPPAIEPKETQSSVGRTKQITSGLSSPRRRMLAESKVLFDKNNVSPQRTRSSKAFPSRLSDGIILGPEQTTIEFEESIDLDSFHDDSIDVKTLCWSVENQCL